MIAKGQIDCHCVTSASFVAHKSSLEMPSMCIPPGSSACGQSFAMLMNKQPDTSSFHFRFPQPETGPKAASSQTLLHSTHTDSPAGNQARIGAHWNQPRYMRKNTYFDGGPLGASVTFLGHTRMQPAVQSGSPLASPLVRFAVTCGWAKGVSNASWWDV